MRGLPTPLPPRRNPNRKAIRPAPSEKKERLELGEKETPWKLQGVVFRSISFLNS
jgi:hypothetical protein